MLTERPDAPRAGRHAGLYHVALLHPSRLELARAVQRLLVTRTPISGASDHGISEAIYLPDPDGNGLELAADRSRERWGDLSDPASIGPAPLDLEDLLGLVDGEPVRPQADPGLVVGHVHLHVGDVERGLLFYRDVLGFEAMTVFPSAAFVSAGGYHHHLAFNTWRGEGVPPVPEDAVGLRRWTVVIDDAGARGPARARGGRGRGVRVARRRRPAAARPVGQRGAVRERGLALAGVHARALMAAAPSGRCDRFALGRRLVDRRQRADLVDEVGDRVEDARGAVGEALGLGAAP